MKEEWEAIEKNGSWELISSLADCWPIGLKWVFKIKKNSKGEVSRHDAHFVGKGYSQRYVIQYDKVFAPFARFESI